MTTTDLEKQLVRANPVSEPDELRLSPCAVDARCTAILERTGDMSATNRTQAPRTPARPQRSRSKKAWAFALGLLVILVAVGGAILIVGGGDTNTAVTPVAATVGAVTTTTAERPTTIATTAPTTTTPTTTTVALPTTTVASPPDPTLPGAEWLGPPRPFEPPVVDPPEGLILLVVGIEHDGRLNVRQGPGLTPIVTTLGPTDRVNAGGEGRELANTTWWSVGRGADVDGDVETIGWVNASYLTSWTSAKHNLTSTVTEAIDDVHFAILDDLEPVVIATTMQELGQLVAETFVVDGYPLRVAMAIAPTPNEPGLARFDQVTFDVVSDDTLGLRIATNGLEGQTGWRLRITGRAHNGAFVLTEVEGQVLLHACACWADH